MDEPLLGFRVPREIGREELQGAWAVELEILGFVDNAHAAFTELVPDLAVGDAVASLEVLLNHPSGIA